MEALRRELDVAPEREIFDPPLSRAFVAALIDPTSYAKHAETFRRRALVEAQATARRLAFHCQLGAEAAFLAGDDATGYEMLERASEAGLFDLHWLELCPALDPVRGEARFASLAAAVRERAVAVFDALYGG
jgi:serine/threonine-protein kinase